MEEEVMYTMNIKEETDINLEGDILVDLVALLVVELEENVVFPVEVMEDYMEVEEEVRLVMVVMVVMEECMEVEAEERTQIYIHLIQVLVVHTEVMEEIMEIMEKMVQIQ